MHSAREAYTKAESSNRIKRGLRHPVRCDEEMYSPGEKVFFKTDGSPRWRGEATVIGQHRKVVFIRFGSRLHRVPTCRLTKKSFYTRDDIEKSNVITDETEDKTGEEHENEEENDSDRDSEYESTTDEESGGQEGQNESAVEDDEVGVQLDNALEDATGEEPINPDENSTIGEKRRRGPPPQFIPEDGSWEGKNMEEVNIVFIPKSRHGEEIVIKAKAKELNDWKEFEVMDEVKDKGQKTSRKKELSGV